MYLSFFMDQRKRGILAVSSARFRQNVVSEDSKKENLEWYQCTDAGFVRRPPFFSRSSAVEWGTAVENWHMLYQFNNINVLFLNEE